MIRYRCKDCRTLFFGEKEKRIKCPNCNSKNIEIIDIWT